MILRPLLVTQSGISNLTRKIYEREDQFICRTAQTPEQIAELIEAGFTYICEKDGILYFRKTK